jgi:hypothetical protein
MSFILRPWQLFFLILSGLVNSKQQEIIEFQPAQIRAIMDRMGRKRILLTDDQRRVLAVKAKTLGRRALIAFSFKGTVPLKRSFETLREKGGGSYD